MNKSNLKAYAPQARLDFIAAVTARANLLGITAKGASVVAVRGDLAIIDGREWPLKIVEPRKNLIARIKLHGFEQSMEEVAYTWFNRFAALRFMEIHDYLDHGWRVISSRDGGLPEILGHAIDVSLPGLSQSRAQEMRMAGNQDNELYRLVLVAQCNALSRVMPFLFERIDDLTELLLPDNLLRTDSIIAKLVVSIPEDDWKEIEIIGWLYQFYISEKKDQVIGKVVKSEDIPAATQLFTPNWIVQYLVQNSVGRLWLMANPHSTLASEWPYYITPAEQTPEVQAQLDALIQTRVREDGDTLNPESITVLDPACGSGHILVVAYDVLKAIYLERGYQPRAIPRLILEKNLYGLDIDDRAAQMAGFALLMKARADDRRLFTAKDDVGNLQPPKLNVLSLQESKGLSVDELATHLAPFKVQRATISALMETFEHAKTFGSLIQIPYALKTHLAALPEALALVQQSGELYASAAADDLLPLVQQAQMLAMQFDSVVANPPYMGNKAYCPSLKQFVGDAYAQGRSDLYGAFTLRNVCFARDHGLIAMITIPNWMFLSSFEDLRNVIYTTAPVSSLVHNGRGVWGSDFGSCAYVLQRSSSDSLCGRFLRLFDKQGSVSSNDELERRFHTNTRYSIQNSSFKKIPGSPVAYWAKSEALKSFVEDKLLGDSAQVKIGMGTGKNEVFLRNWWEVNFSKIEFSLRSTADLPKSAGRYFPYNKGGDFRLWYGNLQQVVWFDAEGREIMNSMSGHRENGGWSHYFNEGITWSFISSSKFGVRFLPHGAAFDVAGSSLFVHPNEIHYVLGFLSSKVCSYFLSLLNPTLNYQAGNLKSLPIKSTPDKHKFITDLVKRNISLSKSDWDQSETSWDFTCFIPLVSRIQPATLNDFHQKLEAKWSQMTEEMQRQEEENNRVFIDAYGLNEVLSPEVPLNEISLSCNPHYQYGGERTQSEMELLLRADTMGELVSYAIGCMMGRYSLDEPGLIYAHAGNVGFDPGRYATFPADADGIVPITDELWFADDAPSRIREFLRAVWGQGTLEENMAWLAESLGTKASETPDETIRRYIADKFFKEHLKTYKKRPIYWLFSSGKQGAFQALIYLHRYSEGTLARMRTEYVVPLTSKIAYRLDMLAKDANASSSTAARIKILKQAEVLRKKQTELLAFDEKLRHYADMRIAINLDDGVKVNYAKFGDLLAESKAITGGADE